MATDQLSNVNLFYGKNEMFTNFTYNFHVVDQAVSVGPRVRGVAAERVDVNLLARVQIVQGLGKQVDGVVHECGFRLQVERGRERVRLG